MIRNGRLTHDWRKILESLPSSAPWGNAMWEKAARFIDLEFDTSIIRDNGKYSDAGITAGIAVLAKSATEKRVKREARDAGMATSWRRK